MEKARGNHSIIVPRQLYHFNMQYNNQGSATSPANQGGSSGHRGNIMPTRNIPPMNLNDALKADKNKFIQHTNVTRERMNMRKLKRFATWNVRGLIMTGKLAIVEN